MHGGRARGKRPPTALGRVELARRGNLFFVYRIGASGRGDLFLHRYDSAAASWTRVGMLFSMQGTYGPWQDSTSRCPYLDDLVFDGRNRLHASWVYRETGASWASPSGFAVVDAEIVEGRGDD